MWRDWLLRAAQLVGSLVGALALASLLDMRSLPIHGFAPILSAFFERFLATIQGDFGRSIVTGAPAMQDVIAVFPFTLQLLAGGFTVALLLGIPLGVLLSASKMLRAAAAFLQVIAATPVFVAALALIWIAVRVLHWNETSQTSALSWAGLTQSHGWSAGLGAFVLPALTVGAAGAARVQRSLRRATAVAQSSPYRSGLRMMGLSALDIDLRYVLPDVLAALLRDLGEIVLALISATAVAEWVFHRDGDAVLFLKSVAFGDWKVAAAVLFVFASMALIANFLGVVASRFIVPARSP